MHVQRYADRASFLDHAEPFLRRAEVENGLMLGMDRRGSPFDRECYFATVEDRGEVVAGAVRTPPYGLIVTRAPVAALDPLVENIAGVDPALPSVVGPEPSVSEFASRWSRRLDRRTIPIMRMRVFEATRVVQAQPLAPGSLRLATEEDFPVVAAWVAAFHQEAHSGSPLEPGGATRDDIIKQQLFIWDDRGPVSIATVGSRTDRSARIALAYTPPELRGQGYASACVGGLTQRLLDDGAAFCCITTDVTNRTTNKIYPMLGYRPVCDTTNINLNAG